MMKNNSFESDQKSIYERIAEVLNSLSPAERRVAEYVLSKGGENPDTSLSELAKAARASESAVVRMCQGLGFSGYRTFRLQWVRETAEQAPHKDLPPGLSGGIIDAVVQTGHLLAKSPVEEAARTIAEAEKVIIYGSGGSGFVGQLAAEAFSAAGYLTVVFSDTALRSVSYSLTSDTTAVLIISHRGQWPEVMERVASDKRRGAKIIVLTSMPNSDLALQADFPLITGCAVGTNNRLLNLSSARVAQTVGIQVLVDELIRQQSLAVSAS